MLCWRDGLQLLSKLRAAVPFGVVQAIYRAASRPLPTGVFSFQLIRRYCVGHGLEIGPGRFPYCDARTTTFVEKYPEASDGMRRPDLIADASAVPLPDGSQDYVFSSHVLEHLPDTIRTLHEWLRLLRRDGVLFLLLPHADRTFDRHREKTALEHHLRDFDTLGDAPDHSHDEEARAGWSQLEDLQELEANHRAAFGADMWDFDHRLAHGAMHYHVWTQDEVVRLLQHLGLRIVAAIDEVADRRDSFAVVARKI
jgi:SAM-dependent methyltransferase